MEIGIKKDGNNLTVSVEGRVDSSTTPKLEEQLKGLMPDAEQLVFDLEKTEYISSAGLRVFLASHKRMTSKGGKMIILSAKDSVKAVFALTGMDKIFDIR